MKLHRFLACPHLTIFLFGYVFYMLIFPFLYIANLIPYEYSEADILYSLISSTIGLLAFNVAYSLILVPKSKMSFLRDTKNGLRTMGSNYKNALVLIFIIILMNISFNQYVNYGIIISTLMLFATSTNNTKANNAYLLIALTVIVIFVATTSTGRRDLVSALIIWSVVAANFNRPSNFGDVKKSFLIGLIGFIGLTYITLARSFGASVDVFENIPRVLSAYEGIIGSLLVLADFAIAYDNYMQIIENVKTDGFIDLQSFYRIFLIPIPRELLIEKPLDVQILIVETGYARNTFAGGTSQSTTLIGEFYWNFGIITVVFGMLLFGYYARCMDGFFKKLSRPKMIVTLVMLPFTFLVWRGAFSTTFVYSLINLIMSLTIFYLYSFLVKRR